MKRHWDAMAILLFLFLLMGLLSFRYGHFQSTHLGPLYGDFPEKSQSAPLKL
ncbi:MAG: hypothetical protein OXB88_09450 [Bacteriovoracales bacterium]|nr:hypothetical protein [Bacteriovoracales bacterium]